MPAEDSAETDAQCLCSDAVRCSWSGIAGHASAKRFIPLDGWHVGGDRNVSWLLYFFCRFTESFSLKMTSFKVGSHSKSFEDICCHS